MSSSLNLNLGWGKIPFPHSELKSQVFEGASLYFSSAQKQPSLIPEVGYNSTKYRECYVVRDPLLPKTLEPAFKLFEKVHEIGLQVVAQIEIDLALKPTSLTNLIQKEVGVTEQSNDSLLRLLQYQTEGFEGELSCAVHEDLGLISIIPPSSDPGLEILNFMTGEFDSAENLLSANEAIILVGETLSFLSNNKFLPATHRVRRTQTKRISSVYQMRLIPNAILDSKCFESPITGTFKKPFRLTAQDYLDLERKNRSSVNNSYGIIKE